MFTEYTVVLIKPDGVRRRLLGEVIARFEKTGLRIAALKMVWVEKTIVGKHYRDDDDYLRSVGEKTLENYRRYGFDPEENLGTRDPLEIGRLVRRWNMKFLSSGPLVALLLSGPSAIPVVRKIVGPTFPAEAPPGTIRGDFGVDSAYLSNRQKRSVHNVIHASGSAKEAEFERKLWFREEEIFLSSGSS